VAILEKDKHTYMEFEPGTAKSIDNYKAESWMSENPNIDIRHGNNLTAGRFFNFQGAARAGVTNVKRH